MPSNPEDETSFRISGDPSVSITKSEVEAQQAAQRKLDDLKRREGALRDLTDEEVSYRESKIDRYRNAGKAADEVRVGMNPDIRMPDEESIQAAIEAGDMEAAHLMRLQQVKPGTPEFMAKAPPGEEVIEVYGPKGAEGFGLIEKQVGTGPNAGKTLVHFQEPEPFEG